MQIRRLQSTGKSITPLHLNCCWELFVHYLETEYRIGKMYNHNSCICRHTTLVWTEDFLLTESFNTVHFYKVGNWLDLPNGERIGTSISCFSCEAQLDVKLETLFRSCL